MERIKNLLKGAALCSLVLLNACSFHGSHKPSEAAKPASKKKQTDNDGPPLIDRDVSTIPNATPKHEPLSKYGNMSTYEVWGKRYKTRPHSKGYEAEGIASWYGRKFHGQRTSSGEVYDMFGMTAAHRELPLPTYAKVKNLKNGKEVIVKITDRGPFHGNRLIDLSYAAAKKLGIHATGTAPVRVTAIDPSHWHKQQKAILLAQGKQHGKTGKKSSDKSTQLALADKSKTKANAKNGANKKGETTTLALANTNTDKKIYIQLGAFTKKMNAEQLAQHAGTLATAAEKSVQILPTKLSDKNLYKVWVGPMKNEAEANQLKKKLGNLNGLGTVKLVYK